MNATALEPATWPSDAHVQPRRWALRLLAGVTDELHALARGHTLLTRLLEQPDPLSTGTLIDALRDIDRTIVTPTDTVALLELARPHHHEIHQLLRDALYRRTDALMTLRRLTTPLPFNSTTTSLHIDHHHARTVLHHVLALLDQTGQALARADDLLTRELTAGHHQPTTRPTSPP